MKKVSVYVFISLLSAFLAVMIYGKLGNHSTIIKEESSGNANFKFASVTGGASQDAFIQAAKVSTPAVVHINTEVKVKQRKNMQTGPFWQFFGMPYDQGQMPDQMQQGAGFASHNFK